MIGVGLAETRSAVALSLILRRRGWLSLAIEHLVVRGRLVEVREHHGRLGGGQMRASLRRRGGRGSPGAGHRAPGHGADDRQPDRAADLLPDVDQARGHAGIVVVHP